MMATKPTTPIRERRLSPSSPPPHHSSAPHLVRPNQKTTLTGGIHTSPPAKKAVPNFLKPKASSSEPSPRRTSTASTSTITNATRKIPSVRKLAEKAQLPLSPTALQRSLKPASPMPKSSSSSRPHGDKATQTVTRNERIGPISKSKSTGSAPLKKKDDSAIIAAPSPQVMLSLDHEVASVIERPVREHWQSDCEKVVEALNVINEEEIKFISSLIEEENQIGKLKGGEPEDREEVLEHRQVLEITNEPVVLEKVPKQVEVAVAAPTLEKEADVQKVDEVIGRVEPEVKKSKLSAVVASIVAATPAVKKKDAPRSNDVIEETKSKLMGSRRNRVLALVGAFETVISQQDLEGQPTQKAPQVQHCLQIQQVEQSLVNQTDKLRVENTEKQEDQEAQNFQLERGHKIHEGEENGEQQVNGEVEKHLIKEEGTNKPLESGEKGEEEMLKEEEVDKALEIRVVEEDVTVQEEKADKILQNSKEEADESPDSV